MLLALSIGIGRARDALIRPATRRFWKSSGQLFLLYGLTVPLLSAVLSGHSMYAILRDIFPFLFMFLPLFALPLLRARPYYYRTILCAIILIALLFSLRSLVMRYASDCALWCTQDLLYLENMPTVLFTCLLLLGGAMQCIYRRFSMRHVILACGLGALALVPFAAMAVTLQRASIGAMIIYILLILMIYLYQSPRRAFGVILFGGGLLLLMNISFSTLLTPLWDKTGRVGLNMRPQEFAAVWSVITADWLTFLFGIGWGGKFHSPAVGGLSVNFTHNFFSTVLLKMGITGLICCIAYIAGLLERLIRVIIMHPVIGLALAAPILIDLTLYASFKSLDFGLVLLLISGSLVYLRQSESLRRY